MVSQNTQTEDAEEVVVAPPEEVEAPHEIIPGIWTPLTPIAKATVLHTLFPKQSTSMLVPLGDALPPHVLVMFEAFKRREVHVVDYILYEYHLKENFDKLMDEHYLLPLGARFGQ